MYKYLKISTLVLLFWYVGLRGILLAMSNESSIDWMKNPIGTSIALCSLVYLGFAYAFLPIKKPTYFILATMGLFLANLYCLEEMTKLFIHDFTLINFAYFLLDCYILSYYSVMWRYCCITSDNKILCPTVIIQLIK
jgi:hypothetical protein